MARKKILIADDSALFMQSAATHLTAEGYDVLTAEDGSSAVATIRKNKPDLLLLDLSFPPDVGSGGGVAWDGFLILDWVRRMHNAEDLPVIIVSGTDPIEFKDRAIAAGVIGGFQKPVNFEKLLELIQRVLNRVPASA